MNPLLIPLGHELDDRTAQCAKPGCDVWDRPERMAQCIACDRCWCEGHWPNDYDGELCLDCWCQRMERVQWALRGDVFEAARAELLEGRKG